MKCLRYSLVCIYRQTCKQYPAQPFQLVDRSIYSEVYNKVAGKLVVEMKRCNWDIVCLQPFNCGNGIYNHHLQSSVIKVVFVSEDYLAKKNCPY